MDENIQGKYFSITDPENVNTVIYQVNRTDREYANSPKFTVERLDYTEEFIGAKKKKTFYVDNPEPDGNPLVIMSFSKERVVINMGLLDYDVVKISKKPMPVKFTTVFTENDGIYQYEDRRGNVYDQMGNLVVPASNTNPYAQNAQTRMVDNNTTSQGATSFTKRGNQ